MLRFLKKLFTTSALIVLFLSVGLGLFTPRPAHAQFADILTELNTTFSNIFDTVSQIYDFASVHIGDAAAVAYKNVLSGVLNTLAAETAKAIASGDWNAPVFSFKKGFYQSLADAAAGDLLSSFVSGATGIDLCNYQPDLTLNLVLPLLKLNDVNYQYKPKCTLSGISQNLQRIDLKKSVHVGVSVQTYSMEDFASGFGRLNNNSFFTNTVFHKSYSLLAGMYKSKDASPLMKDLSDFIDKVLTYKKDKLNKNPLSEADKVIDTLLSDDAAIKTKKKLYTCGFANDLQNSNFAIFNKEAGISDCQGTQYAKTLVADQFNTWKDKAKDWVSDESALASLVSDMKAEASGDAVVSGMRRMEYPYTLCYNAMNRAFNVSITNTEKITPQNQNGGITKETQLIVKGGAATRTFLNNSNMSYVTYSQGAPLTAKEFAACQVAFNSFQLMNYPEDVYKQSFGGLFNPLAPGVRLSDDTKISDWAFMFNKQWALKNAGSTDYGSIINQFIFNTVYYQSSGDTNAAGQRKYVLDKINNVTAEILGIHETFTQMVSNLNLLLVKSPKDTTEQLTANEKLQDQQTALQNCSANELCAQKQLAEASANASSRKANAENSFAQEKGTLLNPETTAVSEQAKNVPEVNQNELSKAQSGQAPTIGEYTNHIFADSAGLFMSVLFNTLLKNGYKSLNNRFFQPNGIKLPGDLQAQLDAKNQSALAGYVPPGETTSCNRQDLDIMQSFVNISKSLSNISKTGSGAITGLSPACKTESDAEAKANNKTPGGVDAVSVTLIRIGGGQLYQENLTKAVAGGYQGLGVYKQLNNSMQDSAQSSVTAAPVKTILDNSRLSSVNFNVQGNFDLLNEMSICPQGSVNHSIYQCAINPSIKDAIIQKLSIRQAIEKGLLSDQAILGIDATGKVPDTTSGFSLAAVQLLRKSRVVPIGFEFATRLKIACYQKETYKNDQSAYEKAQPHALYPWMADECNFDLGDDAKESVYRKEVLNATLKQILAGYSQTGTLNEVCGNFNVINDSTGTPHTTMSAFCGLINPDWVLAMPTPKCVIDLENSDILQAPKGVNRLQYCTELQSETTPNNYGYCLKEKNVWDVEGKSCPAQYSTCSTFVFKDGTIGNFNKDSLVGSGLCSAKNAGCTWVSTIKNGQDWQDTITKKTQSECVVAGGTWNGVSCSNSRLYLTGNVSSCSAQQAGCSEVFGFKVPGNNLASDGSFEYGAAGTVPANWSAYAQNQIPSPSGVTVDSCLLNGGTVTSHCAINYPISKTNDCLAQGGTIQSTGACSLTLVNAEAQQCGYCLYTGADATQNHSAQALNQTDCLALTPTTSYQWKYGGADSTFTQECKESSPATFSCASNDASCLMEVAVKNDELTPDAEASEGTHSMEIKLDSTAMTASVSIEYPLHLSSDASSSIVLAGDSFSASFDLKSLNIPTASTATAEVSLIKTFQGGKVDSKTVTVPLAGQDSFTTSSISMTALTDGTDLTLRIVLPHLPTNTTPTPSSPKVLIDAVKIEYNSPSQILSGALLASSYSSYTSNTPFAVKLPPDYLKCRGYSLVTPAPVISTIKDKNVCFSAGYFWDDSQSYGPVAQCYRGAPDVPECANYARVCSADEAGCQLFKPVIAGASIPGVIGQDNYCPTECVGYFAYKQLPTAFEPAPVAPLNYFIASTAGQCKVENVGCDEFTNVSLASAGNEPLEYYSGLQQCIVPGAGKGEAGYFIWQGTAGGPPQLKTFTLEAMGGSCIDSLNNAVHKYDDDPLDCRTHGNTFVYNGQGGPAVSTGGSCTNPDFNGSPKACTDNGGTYLYGGGFCEESALGIDLNCLKYFDKTGNFYYRNSSFVVQASSDCKILRKTNGESTTCLATNGRWDTAVNACFYDALPALSQQCSAEASGCRAYTGSTGQNNFNVLFDTFEGTTDTGWRYSGTTTTPAISSESITTLGHSLYVDSKAAANTTGSIAKPVSITKGKSYIISFWAKRNDPQSISVGARFSSAPSGKEFVTSASNRAVVDSNWKQFKFGPIIADWEPGLTNVLQFSNANDVYFDNITIQALQDTIYVKKDSWRTPATCDMTNLGLSIPQAQLGCQLYVDGNAQTVALKSFTRLCRESSVGCQLVFDTKNSSSPLSQSFNASNSSLADDLTVPADTLRAVVVDKTSSCDLNFAGCMAVGYPANSATGAVSFASDIYVINNVDQYEDPSKPILCKDEELGCKEVRDSKGNTQYLKIETNNTCSYATQVTVPHVDLQLKMGTQQVDGWFHDGLQGVGCMASLDQQRDCTGGNLAWNGEYNQCTSVVPTIAFNDCKDFTADYKKSLANSCRSDYKGYWFDNSGAESGSCGCARYPFDYYKANEYPEHNVSAAVCAPAYDQCTEFLDFNPNFIANGDFENINDLDNSPANWLFANAPAGKMTINYNYKSSGSAGLQLIKTTQRDLPRAEDVATGNQSLLATQSYAYQLVGRLEKGKTYSVNFHFISNDSTVGKAGKNVDPSQSCGIPAAAVEIVPHYAAGVSAALNLNLNDAVNKNNFKVFGSTSQMRQIDYGFLIPEKPPVVSSFKSDAACTDAGGFWNTKDSTCYASDPNQPTTDYEVRVYGPLNGVCVNQLTGEKAYLKADSNNVFRFPLDRNLCEGAASTAGLSAQELSDYRTILGIGSNPTFIAPFNNVGIWKWQGNCPDSSLVIDDFQIALAQDHQYYFIDDATLNKGNCTEGNWDQGCISFTNVSQGTQQLMQVKADRQCEEWLSCQARDSQTQRCTSWQSCREQDGANCVRPGSTNDPLRYVTENGLLKNIDISDYRKRLGVSEEFRINRWRAGDYSGFTIPNLPPIEQMFDRVPGSTTQIPADQLASLLPLLDSTKRLSSQPLNNSLYRFDDVCRGYPEATSPFSEILKNLIPGFEGVNTIVKYISGADNSPHAVSPFDRLSICNYVKYSYQGRDLYVASDGEPDNIIVDSNTTSLFGNKCAPGADNCKATTDLGRKEYKGDVGACIEPAIGVRVYGGIVSPLTVLPDGTTGGDQITTFPGKTIPGSIDNVNGPTACMTYYPL